MRLIDQGKVKGDDPVHIHIDPFLKKNNGTTLEELFGSNITKATVLDVIRMSAGIPDFEQGSRDGDILKAGNKVWPVYSNIRYAAEYSTKMGGTCQKDDDCNCGRLPLLTKGFCSTKGKASSRCVKVGPYPGCWGK